MRSLRHVGPGRLVVRGEGGGGGGWGVLPWGRNEPGKGLGFGVRGSYTLKGMIVV